MKVIVAIIIAILLLGTFFTLVGCQNDMGTLTSKPIIVPTEGKAGESIIVKIKVTSSQPCELILTKSYKTDVVNYFSPYTAKSLAYPENDGTITWNQSIPWNTVPGQYILRIVQMRSPQDTTGREIFSQAFWVR